MSSTPETDPLVEAFRQLRPAVHDWLARDLTTNTSLDTTRAYADLTFAFGFARLGANDFARECVRDAENTLAAQTNSAHRWLLRLYRYRIEQALDGRPHGGLVPDGAALPNTCQLRELGYGAGNSPIVREDYAARTLTSWSRVLDPEGCTDPYGRWTNANSTHRGRLRTSAT